ncbi:MAG: hypothetical protein Q9207_008340 [Kuettlingeria erythrocarpa]
MSKSSVIIVPGFWGHPSSYDQVIAELKDNGYDANVVQLPSWGCEPPTKTLLDDAEAVRSEVTQVIKAGHSVIVVMHSAGGFIAPEGLQGLLAPDIAQSGGSGGVTSLVFMAAPCMSLGEVAPPAPWFEYKGDYLWVKDPKETLYSDLPEAEADKWMKLLRHHPAHNYSAKTTQEPWKQVPSVYLKTAQDAVIPIELQDMFALKIPDCSIQVSDAGHSPFLSRPSDVVKAILKAEEQAKVVNRFHDGAPK